MTTTTVRTDFEAGTLSDEDREAFLRGQGMALASPAEAARLQAEWPDQDILEAMEVGLG